MRRKKVDFIEPGNCPVQECQLFFQILLFQACIGTAESLKEFCLWFAVHCPSPLSSENQA